MAASLAKIKAPAPSLVCELLPAVTEPRAENTVRNLPKPSKVVSGRAPSSKLMVRSLTETCAESRSTRRSCTVTGVISSLNSPACMAATARACDCTAKASWSSRETFHCCATFSAVRPMP